VAWVPGAAPEPDQVPGLAWDLAQGQVVVVVVVD